MAEAAIPAPKEYNTLRDCMSGTFVSYSHHQQEWVWNRLVPILEGAGVHGLLLDADRFRAGKGVIGQMDATQDLADVTLAVLSEEYLASEYCKHEMERAFATHTIIPIVRHDCEVPAVFDGTDPILRVDLRDPEDPQQWGGLLEACRASAWLQAAARVAQYLQRGQSVNLVCTSEALWKPLLRRVRRELIEPIGEVDLERGMTLTRPSLVEQILGACGRPGPVPAEPYDLIELDRRITDAQGRSLVAFLHFDQVSYRQYYNIDLFSTLRHLMMGSRKLVLLAHSHREFASILPENHPLSDINITTVALQPKRST
jgi:TIR domain